MHYKPTRGRGASLSRQSFIAIATTDAASILPEETTAQADGETDLLTSTINQQLDAFVAQLKTVLMHMHPEATEVGCTKPSMVSNPEGSFSIMFSGRIPSQPFEGDGRYMLSMDGYPKLFYIAHRHTHGRTTGDILKGQYYYSATAIHEDGYIEQPRRIVSPRIFRKVEGGRG